MHIIGVGQRLRGDDAVGPLLIDGLASDGTFSSRHRLTDTGTDAWTLLEILGQENEPVLIIDCADMNEEPGSCRLVDPDMLMNETGFNLSLHGMDMGGILELARSLNPILKCRILAIQGAFTGFSDELSHEVLDKIRYINDIIREEAEKNG